MSGEAGIEDVCLLKCEVALMKPVEILFYMYADLQM